jgi:hypothetical protein
MLVLSHLIDQQVWVSLAKQCIPVFPEDETLLHGMVDRS